MERLCDLHTHSTYSDGTCTPEEILELAEKAGLYAVALCDHNTVDGLPAFMERAKDYPVMAVPGIEISADYLGSEVHILGLFIEGEHYSQITDFLMEMHIKKEQSNLELVDALGRNGICLDYARIKAATPGGQVNRAVIAAEMVRKGYCQTVEAAFSRWLSPKCGLYMPPKRPDVFRVIRFLRSIGAVSVLAHPLLNLEENQLRRFLKEARENGLDGMEVYYPLFDSEKTMLLKQVAKEFGLCESGGSDFHGANKPDIAIGSGRDNIAVPKHILDNLQKKIFSSADPSM